MAALARLALGEEEVEPMARELSAVLDHVARISELDLENVPPTSHVVEVTGALRADEPTPCLPREVVLSQAPLANDEGFLVPSPQA
ncbi:MAG: gatC [Solirubrobacterales bacterium]|nr:gatC [Solirubrobacterales bacterium]MCW3026559.1 gatC [Solirubrobacterales bacterium]